MSIKETPAEKGKKIGTTLQKSGVAWRSAFALAILLQFFGQSAQAQTFQSDPVIAGYRDFNYNGGGVTSEPTEDKPESKLWYNDGFWWGVLWDNVAEVYRIHKFDPATQNWTNVGPDVDERPRSSADALWDGTNLYIATHAKLTHKSEDGPDTARLYRYSYDSGTDSYAFDDSVSISGPERTESLVLAKDSNDKLWITWSDSGKVMINRSTTDDFTWGTEFVLPVQGNDSNVDDISTMTAFGGDKVGVLWSNQDDQRFYFAVHPDDSSDIAWLPRETVLASGVGNVADNHLNLACSPTDGTIVAAVKTSFTGAGLPDVYLVKREAATGIWSSHVVWLTDDNPTRPIAVLNSETDSVYVFAKSSSGAFKSIYMKSAHLTNPVFSSGLGKAFIQSAQDDNINNATSTKQCVTSVTGMLILASDKDTRNYMHGFVDFNNTPPVAQPDTVGTNEETAIVIDVIANDTDVDGTIDPTTVTVVLAPSDGATSVNSTTGEITYSPDLGFNGTDVFRYTVADDDADYAIATTVTVNVNISPIAQDDSVTTSEDLAIEIDVLSNDSDPDGAIDPTTLTIVTPPDSGTAMINVGTATITYTPNANFKVSIFSHILCRIPQVRLRT